MLPIAPDTLLQQRYRILDILGEGEFGRTYLATDRSRFDEHCAIKEFTPSAQYPAAVARAKEFFKQETVLLYQLQNPQIPRFWATFEEQNRLFLVQDYIEGETYQDMLDKRRGNGNNFTEAEVWRLLVQILPVLGYMHSIGVIHRDISPENIILRDSDLLPVPIDFGVVKEFNHKLQLSPNAQSNTSVGKTGYAPPEQLTTGQIYPNSDLYSLAVTAIVLLTGKEPSALFANGQMNWDWRKWTQLDDGFADILRRMLSAEPRDRYQSAVEVFQALQPLNISATTEPAAHRPSTMPTMAVGGRRSEPNPDREQTALTNLNTKSIWEKPQVLVPLAVIISLLAGVGSWFGVSHLLYRRPSEPVATTPPKPADFNNPTIPTDDNASPTSGEVIQPLMGQAILKEGSVKAGTPVRYHFAAMGGQNLDIKLVPAMDSPAGSLGTDPAQSDLDILDPSPTSSPSPNLSKKSSKSASSPTPSSKPLGTPVGSNQVLMTILSPTGTPIDAQADRVVGWRGQIPTTGDYTIELRPIQGLKDSNFPYKLSVTQLETAPTTLTPPSGLATPSGASVSPLNIPIPIGGNGLNPIPSSTPSNSSSPSFSPSPVPIEVPKTVPPLNSIESEQPVIPKTSPPSRERKRIRQSEAETPTPRRRRARQSEAETPTPRRTRQSETETPTPRRRRARQSEAETSTPRSQEERLPTEEKQVPIPVPEPESQMISPPKSAPAMTPPTGDNSSPAPTTTDGDSKKVPQGAATDPD